jgi:hypothetical protein
MAPLWLPLDCAAVLGEARVDEPAARELDRTHLPLDVEEIEELAKARLGVGHQPLVDDGPCPLRVLGGERSRRLDRGCPEPAGGAEIVTQRPIRGPRERAVPTSRRGRSSRWSIE